MSDRPLRVGVACFSTFGGSGVIAAEVANALAARGHAVHVFSDERPVRLEQDGTGLVFHLVTPPIYPQLPHSLYTLALASKIVEVARRERLDLVHAHYALPHAASAELARQVVSAEAGRPALRVVTTLHGTDITLVGQDPSYLPLTRFAVLASDAVTVPSRWLGEVTRRTLELPETHPIDVVPNFVDVDRFRPRRSTAASRGEPPVLIHVSNFRPLKRLGDVVAIFARVRAAGPARLRLVGDGPERAGALAELDRLGLAGDVEVAGEAVDLPAILGDADLFLLPSETESFGLAALEALACGLPVIASDVGGLPEVVTDGEVGFLAAVGDVETMAARACRLIADPVLRSAMGVAARRRAETLFRPEPAIDSYLRVYRRAIEG